MKYHSHNILLLLFVTSSALAQQLPFRNYTAKDGLIRNAVRTVCQDSKGFMWFGTTDGVDRYDGATFTHYTTANGLANNFVNKIIEDRDSNLWIATNYAGISNYVDGRFVNYLVAPNKPDGGENRVNAIHQDRDGTFWIGTDGGLFQFDGEKFTAVQSANPLIRHNVYAIFEDSQHALWFGAQGGLCRLATDSHADFTTIAGTDGFEFEDATLAEDGQGNIWYGSDRGLKIIRNLADKQTNHASASHPPALQFLSDQWIRALFFDPENNLWIGTRDHGLYKYSVDRGLTNYTMANGLTGNNIGDIYRDREGNLWLATNTGVSKLAGEQVVNYTTLDGLPEHSASALVQDGNGNFWFGTRRGLSKLANGKISNYTTANGLRDNYMLCLLKDKTGTVWVGTPNGVSKIVSIGSKDTFVTYREQMGTNIIYQDEEGNLWLGSHFGVSLFANGKLTNFDFQEQNNFAARAIVRDNHGDLWVGFLNGGIVRFAVQVGKHGKPSLTAVARYRQAEGLADDHIRSSFKDRDGNLWFATDKGADCLHMGESDIASFRHFTMKEGLAGDGVLALYEDGQGKLWFGTYNGVTCFDPAKQRPNVLPPPVYITQFQIFGKADTSALQTMKAELAYDQHSVVFEYIGISFKDETTVRYLYMLEGLDTEWSEVADRRHVNYTHLPSGHYLFKVKAQNADGVWSVTPATFAFRIATPFWRTWWFIALTIIAAIGIISGVYRYRVRQIIEMERIRSKIATDLHDDLGSTLSSISVFSEMAKQETEQVAPKAAQMLQRIGESSRTMLEAIDDIVWAINPDNDALDHVILRLRDFATEMFEASGIAFTLNFPENINHLKLSMEMRRDFYLIFKEAVNNVVKHSRCHHAAISITANEQHLALTISDDGIGFNRNHSFSGNGIKNIEKRAKAIGGAVTIASQEGKGTTIILNVRIT